MTKAIDTLRQGAQILAQKLGPLGFKFAVTDNGRSSGGEFAEGIFKKGDRQLWLSLRNGLGLVCYRKGVVELDHDGFMRALGLHGVARYPSGWSEDRMVAFVDLLADLDHCDAFLRGDGSQFVALARSYVPPPKGFAAIE